MLFPPFMSTRAFATLALIPALPLLFALAACGSSKSPTPADPDAPPVPVAKSSLAREPASGIPASSLTAAVTANNAFALDLYTHLQSQSGSATSNLLTSPISASLALTMTYAGAKGSTATQMASALHYGGAASEIFDGQNALSQALASRAATALAADQATLSGAPPGETTAAPSPSDYQLEVVNSVWGEQTYSWESPFLDVLAQSYGTGVYQEDFTHSFDAARQTINTWVSTETDDKINTLLPVGSLDDSTRMVLVNAIHLKLPWATPFDASATAPASFTTGAGSTVSQPFMNAAATFGYIDDGSAQTVALPLSGNQLEVLITLPHGDLATYEAGLTASSPAVTPPLGQTMVTLSLPKVTFTSASVSLASLLQAMGMVQAFDPHNADFTGLCGKTPDGANLYISDVIQKAAIAIQETGVEASAATAVIASGALAEENPPVNMTVNKPFLLSIVDAPTGAVLFLGHIEDPSSVGSP
jgi:serpin B